MATVTAAVGFNMTTQVVAGQLALTYDGGAATSSTTTFFRVAHTGGKVEEYDGTGFTYSGGFLNGGTITTIRLYDTSGANLLLTVDGMSLNAFDYRNAVQNNNVLAFLNLVFGGGDEVQGASGAETMFGYNGDDELDGGNGDDSLLGGQGDDVLVGGAGNDSLRGGAGNEDLLQGGAGDDYLDGDDTSGNIGDEDVVSYHDASGDVTVDLTQTGPQATGAGTDTIVHVEGVVGSAFNDSLKGDGNDNLFAGLDGNDTIDGGAGVDGVYYGVDIPGAGPTTGVEVNLSLTAAQNTRGAGVDVLLNIENVGGTDYDDTLIGSSGDNRIEGGAGNDSLDGGAGIDTIAFDDQVSVNLLNTGAQNTQGAGVDTIRNFENVHGSDGNDTVFGSNVANVLEGDQGNDSIAGMDGNDTVLGDQGNDSLFGVVGADSVFGDIGNDSIGGGDGDDTLDGGQDDDSLFGGNGDDSVYGDAGADSISGGAGDNLLAGGAGDDTLVGGAGSEDVLIGGTGNDSLDGGDGDEDVVSYHDAPSGVTVDLTQTGAQNTGGGGVDTLVHFEGVIGSEFNDSLKGDAGDNLFVGLGGNDTIDGGAGVDGVFYGVEDLGIGAATGVRVNLGLTTPQDTLGAGVDVLLNIENVGGTDFNDTLIGSSGDNAFEGGDGDDSIDGGAGFDIVYYNNSATVDLSVTTAQSTGAGNDVILNVEGVAGSDGNDTLTGNAANNFLRGDEGDDKLSGGDGNDTLVGDQGADTLTGGAGVDVFRTESAAEFNGDRITDYQLGEQIVLSDVGLASSSRVQMASVGGNTQLQFDADNNGSFETILTLVGAVNGTLTVGSSGGLTNNVISINTPAPSGGGGGVVIPPTTTPTAGDDSLVGSGNADTQAGGGGADRIDAGAGADFVDGDAGDDSIAGGEGDDFVRGGLDNDTVDGGDGSDTVNGNQGSDSVSGGAGDDTVFGGQGSDSVDGGTGDDGHVNGNIGEDIVHGGQGADTCYGGQGSDTVYGDAGDDRLSGDLGNDILFGGDGADRFAFALKGGFDWVGDFNAGQGDRIQLAPGTTFVVKSYAGQTVLELSDGSTIGLAGISTFDASWVVFG